MLHINWYFSPICRPNSDTNSQYVCVVVALEKCQFAGLCLLCNRPTGVAFIFVFFN